MKNLFNSIRVPRPKKNVFNLSHDNKFTTQIGDLTPVFCRECIPGDKFSIQDEVFVRFAPMYAPLLHNINAYVHYFKVPYRLLWSGWEAFITGGQDGKQEPLAPFVYQDDLDTYIENGSITDYLNYRHSMDNNAKTIKLSTLPLRAYYAIYNDYYRDPNLEGSIYTWLGDDEIDGKASFMQSGEDTFMLDLLNLRQAGGASGAPCLTRCYEHDYFTSALPWTQRGDDVTIPFDINNDVVLKAENSTLPLIRNANTGLPRKDVTLRTGQTSGTLYGVENLDVAQLEYGQSGEAATLTGVTGNTQGGSSLLFDPNGTLKVSGDVTTAPTINDLRTATRLQAFLEKRARGGGRYSEQLWSYFGVRSRDSRLQRVEYLGGGKVPILVDSVTQNNYSADSPIGEVAGKGIGSGTSIRFKTFCEEHCFIVGIFSCVPRTGYFQGVLRQNLKLDKFDYYFPEFAHLGEQPIYNAELYLGSGCLDSDGNHKTFGYTPRYAEYKYYANECHGEFMDTLDFWHMSRKFSAQPQLNEFFNHVDNSDFSRVWNVLPDSEGPYDPSTQKLWCQIYHHIKAVRPMPKYGTPTF